MAQARSFVLGECLPPLTLTFTDASNNICQQTADESAIGMELLTCSLAAGGTVLPDLQLAGEVVSGTPSCCLHLHLHAALPHDSASLCAPVQDGLLGHVNMLCRGFTVQMRMNQ
jgi:hypothetical protein